MTGCKLRASRGTNSSIENGENYTLFKESRDISGAGKGPSMVDERANCQLGIRSEKRMYSGFPVSSMAYERSAVLS